MSKVNDEAPFAYDGLDRVIHEKARLGILTSLIAHPTGLAFADLKQLCGLTDGNLSRHLQVLEEAAVVEITKTFERKRPLTAQPGGGEEFLTIYEATVSTIQDTPETPAWFSEPEIQESPTEATTGRSEEKFAGKILASHGTVRGSHGSRRFREFRPATAESDTCPPGPAQQRSCRE